MHLLCDYLDAIESSSRNYFTKDIDKWQEVFAHLASFMIILQKQKNKKRKHYKLIQMKYRKEQ